MLKELWKLIKWLFADRPSEHDYVEIVQMKHFPFSGYSAMSWCGRLVTRKEPDKVTAKTKTHELIHLMQAKQYKYWLYYYAVYAWEWIKGNPFIHPSSSAYYTIPFEMEAYANESYPWYPVNYNPEWLDNYKIKDRKKTYKQHSGTSDWTAYCKTL